MILCQEDLHLLRFMCLSYKKAPTKNIRTLAFVQTSLRSLGTSQLRFKYFTTLTAELVDKCLIWGTLEGGSHHCAHFPSCDHSLFSREICESSLQIRYLGEGGGTCKHQFSLSEIYPLLAIQISHYWRYNLGIRPRNTHTTECAVARLAINLNIDYEHSASVFKV